MQEKTVSIYDLVPNPWQPRKVFNTAKLIDLALDIQKNGLIQPVVVRKDLTNPGKYQIAAGERRLRAFKVLAEGFEYEGGAEVSEDDVVPGEGAVDRVGVKVSIPANPKFLDIPVLIRTMSDEEMMRIALSENGKRSDISPMEEALAFQNMINALGNITQSEFAKKMGVTQPTVANRLRLLKLPQAVQDFMAEGKLGQFAGIKLLGWQAQYNLSEHFIILAATAWMNGREAEVKQLDYGVWGIARIPGVQIMNQYNAKFSPEQYCLECPFHMPTLLLGDGQSISHYCGNLPHFEELNETVPALAKQEYVTALEFHKQETIDKYGEDVLRLADGTPLQDEPKKDSDGRPLLDWKHAQRLRMGNQATEFEGHYNGFDMTECKTCEFFVSVDKGSGVTSHLCLRPNHYSQLFSSHARALADKREAETKQKYSEFQASYASLMLAGNGMLDSVTARFIARRLVMDWYTKCYMGTLLDEKLSAWLSNRQLSTEKEKVGYVHIPLQWIDEELAAMTAQHNLMFVDVVLRAVGMITELTQALPQFSADFLGEINNYTTAAVQSLESGVK